MEMKIPTQQLACLLVGLMFCLPAIGAQIQASNEKEEPTAEDATPTPAPENDEPMVVDYAGTAAPGHENTDDYEAEYVLSPNAGSKDGLVGVQKRAAPSLNSNFLRLGKSGPMKSSSFLRFGRSPSFLRFGRSNPVAMGVADYDTMGDHDLASPSVNGYYVGVPSVTGYNMERPRFLLYDQRPMKAHRRAQSSFIRFGKRSGAPIATESDSDGATSDGQQSNWRNEDDDGYVSYPTASGLIDTDDHEQIKMVDEKRRYEGGDRHTSSFLRFGRGGAELTDDDGASGGNADYFDKEQKRGTSSFIRFGKRQMDKQEQLRELRQRLLHAQMLQERQRQHEQSGNQQQNDVSYVLPYGGVGSHGSFEGGRPRRNMLYFTRLPASKRLLARNFIRLGKRSVSVGTEESSHGDAQHHQQQTRH